MSALFCEGFETHIHDDQMARKYASFSGSMVETDGAFNRAAAPNACVAQTKAFTQDNVAILGLRVIFESDESSFTSGAQGFYFYLSNNEQLHIELETQSVNGVEGRFHIYRGATLIDTTSWIPAEWTYVEFKFTVRDGTDGEYEVRIDEVVDISGDSVNLAAEAADGWDSFGWDFDNNYAGVFTFDDLYLLNGAAGLNDYLGTRIVQGVLPSADGATMDWTGGFEDVDDPADETPDGNVITSDGDNVIALFDIPELDVEMGDVSFVQIEYQAATENSGESRDLTTKFRAADASVGDGSTQTVDSDTQNGFTDILENDPTTSSAWENGDFEAGQIGIELEPE